MTLLIRLLHFVNRFAKPRTLGVQGAVISRDGKVLLVRQTYQAGWQFPGGGVEAGETLRQALARELSEEAAVEVRGEPRLHGVFFNDLYSKRDYIAVFHVDDFDIAGRREPDWEIAEVGLFPVDDLPPATTPETRARLREILEGRPAADLWRAAAANHR